MKNILIVEDNQNIADGIKYAIEKEQYSVKICKTMRTTKEYINNYNYDLILLDIVLPDGNGLELYKYIKSKSNVPIIFVTAKDTEDDIVKGLELGANDYVIKPFRMRELIARIKGILKRNEISSNQQIGNIKFNEQDNIIYKNDERIYLTALEYKLMSILIENRGRLVTREYLLSRIWDISANFVNDNTLTVYMKRLREKIEDNPNKPEIIKTIRGVGYKIEK